MIGQTLGHYRITEKIGAGGMGVVYRARDERLERDVALKVLPAGAVADEAARKRFRKEALALSQLNHPNIATVHDFDSQQDVTFLVMEYIAGETLDQKVKPGPLGEKELLRLGSQMMQGLAAAHEAGVVHRDLKPGNLKVTPDGRLKILDFGLATLRQPEGANAPTRSMTEGKGVAGTLPYMAPEQLRGEKTDHRADIFAAGVVLYEMATGTRPFAQIADTLLNPPPAPRGVSPGLENIILKALDKDPERRYQSARELGVDLERLSSPSVMLPVARRRWLRAPRHAVVLAAITFCPLVAAALVYVYMVAFRGRPAPEIKSLAVLPLKPVGKEAAAEELGLGIADSIIGKVSQISGLTVRPTSAVRRYAAQEADSLEAARQLKVDSVLDGTVQRAGDRVRVSVNLLRVSDGASLWTESIQLPYGDIFGLQDRVAQQVVSYLRVRLSPDDQTRLARRYTPKLEAHAWFLKGMNSYEKYSAVGSRADVDAAVAMFQKAIEADPSYALAHVQLAFSYLVVNNIFDPDPQWMARANQALERARSLDPGMAELHLARSRLLWAPAAGFQTLEALRELKRAEQINPNVGNEYRGNMYGHLGLIDEATRALLRAQEIDPASVMVQNWLAETALLGGRYDEAVARYDRLIALDPNNPGSHTFSAIACISLNRLDDAQRRLDRARALKPGDPVRLSGEALLLARRGRFAEAEARIPEVVEKGSKLLVYHHAAYNIASLYAVQGKSKPAVEWLRKTAETTLSNYPLFAKDAHFDRVRSDPAFVQLMGELKAQGEAYQREVQ